MHDMSDTPDAADMPDTPDTTDSLVGTPLHGREPMHGGDPSYIVAWPALVGSSLWVRGGAPWAGPARHPGPATWLSTEAGQATKASQATFVGSPPCMGSSPCALVPNHIFCLKVSCVSVKINLLQFNSIRPAFAQGVSDHQLFVVIGATIRAVLQVGMEQRHREIPEFEQQHRTKTELEQKSFAIVAVAAAVVSKLLFLLLKMRTRGVVSRSLGACQ